MCLLSCCTYFKNDEKKNITKKNKDFNTTKKLTNESFSDFITQRSEERRVGKECSA